MLKSLILAFFVLVCSPVWAGVDFDQTDDFIGVGVMGSVGSTMDTEGLIWAGWVKSSDTTNIIDLAGTANTGTNTAFLIQLNADGAGSAAAGNIRLFTRDEDAQARSGAVESNTGVTDGNWHHVVIEAHVGLSHVVYLDGVKQTFVNDSTNQPDNTTNFGFEMYLGALNNRGTVSGTFNGIIDEVYMWQGTTNAELTQGEIDLLYGAKVRRIGLQIQAPSLVGYWPFDDVADGVSADTATFLDMSGAGNTGTGNDGANNTGLTGAAGEVLSYP